MYLTTESIKTLKNIFFLSPKEESLIENQTVNNEIMLPSHIKVSGSLPLRKLDIL